MLDWISKEFLGALVVALAVAVVALSWDGPPGNYEPPRNQGSENSQSYQSGSDQQPILQIQCDPNCAAKNSNKVGDSRLLMRVVNKIVDDPLAGGILIANFLLVYAVLRQIKEARESNEARLRAYVVAMVGSQYRQGQSRGLRFEFRPVMLNTGQTPAYEVRTVARLAFLTLAEATAFDFTVADPTGAAGSAVTLGPRQDRFVQAVFDRRLSKTELREFQRFQKSFYVYGTTWYRDAFRRPRHTNFCFSVGWWNKKGQALWMTVFRHSDSN